MSIDIEKNKKRFIGLLSSIDRNGADISSLIYKLESSDFFRAPCSTKNHLAVAGGLCFHALNVYDTMERLNREFSIGLQEDTIIIISLLHDIAKMDKYESYNRNIKKYSENGKKSDESGRYDWVTEWAYKVREDNNRFVFGHYGQNSEYIVNSYIPLKTEESAAIVNQLVGSTDEYKPYDLYAILHKYPTIVALHLAEYLCTFYLDTLYLENGIE